MTDALLAKAERDTVELTDAEHLREYARQLDRCAMERAGIEAWRRHWGEAEEWLRPANFAEEREAARLSDMIYNMVRNG